MANQNRFVLDSYALIGYLEDEPFSNTIQHTLLSARKKECQLFLHAIQLGEVYYIAFREQGKSSADLAYNRIKNFPLTIISSLDEPLLLKAAEIKAGYPVSYADAFAAATSVVFGAVLMTGDSEFAALEKEKIIAVQWL